MLRRPNTIFLSLLLTAVLLAGCAAAPQGASPATTPSPATPTPAVEGTEGATAAASTAALATAPQSTIEPLSTDERLIAQFSNKINFADAKDFTLSDLSGKQWTLSDLKGKIVLLNFWATWCGPCTMEMPHFESLWQRFGADGDVIVLAVGSPGLEGLDTDEAKAVISDFVEKQGFTFPVLIDTDDSIWAYYQQPGIPANYILDRQGNVRLLKSGAFTGEDELYAALEAVSRVGDE